MAVYAVNSFSIEEDYPEVAVGVAGGVVAVGISHYVGEAMESVAVWLGAEIDGVSEAVQIVEYLNSIQNIVIKVVLKLLFIFYVVAVAPWLEELVFREWLHECLGGEDGDTCQKVCRVVCNGLIFGACHISPFQGLANLPIFVVTSLGGMFLETLRIWRGNRVACTTAHMFHNGVALATHMV